MPSEPGVYQFFNKEDKIIYIGKAKNLKKRVSSYFQKNIGSRKTKNLVKNISEIKHIVVSSESDALLLENSLIKKYQPKYNILLRDDKTYPWIVIKNEPFPRVLTTRRVEKDGSEYFGPFTSYKTVRTIMDIFSPQRLPPQWPQVVHHALRPGHVPGPSWRRAASAHHVTHVAAVVLRWI